jgi:hypothetical protein
MYFEFLPKDINLIIFDKLFDDIMFNIEPYLELLGMSMNDYLKYKLNSNILYKNAISLNNKQKIALVFYTKTFKNLKSDLEDITEYGHVYLIFLKDLYDDLEFNHMESTNYLLAKSTLSKYLISEVYDIKKFAIKTILYYSVIYSKKLKIVFETYDTRNPLYIKSLKELKFENNDLMNAISTLNNNSKIEIEYDNKKNKIYFNIRMHFALGFIFDISLDEAYNILIKCINNKDNDKNLIHMVSEDELLLGKRTLYDEY